MKETCYGMKRWRQKKKRIVGRKFIFILVVYLSTIILLARTFVGNWSMVNESLRTTMDKLKNNLEIHMIFPTPVIVGYSNKITNSVKLDSSLKRDHEKNTFKFSDSIDSSVLRWREMKPFIIICASRYLRYNLLNDSFKRKSLS